MTDSIWRLRVFGEPGLEGPDGPVAVRTQRQLGVLLYLALDGPRARRDQVVPLFWPGVPEEKGRHSLTQAMSDLRRTLPGLVEVDRAHVSVQRASTDLAFLATDPWCIERGEILAGMDALGGMDLAQWLDSARERVRRAALRDLEPALSRLEPQERLRLARAMLRLDPACEPAAITVAEEALDRGQVTEAARYLQAHQNHITAELGFDPQLRVASLLKRLERGDLTRARAAILGESLQLRAPETVIVGRDAELEVLAEGWRDAAAGRGRTIRLSGAAGIGKSALVRHFLATLAGRGQAAFFVTCHQATRSVPFALVADLTDAISSDSGFASSDPQWLAELSRIHPVLRRQFPGIPVPEPAPPESIRERLTESLTVILETIADGNPIALAIDDADQADQASLSVLHLVRRRTKRHAVLTLLTSAESGHPDDEHALEADRHLLLQPIPRPAIMQLLRSRVPEDGDTGILERIADIAGGNPLYALTLLGDQSLRESVAREGLYTATWTPPRDLLDAISRAVVQHSTLARRVLSALAVAGTPSTVNLVSEVAGLSEADVRAAAVELLANDRIRITGDEMELASPLWQSAIYSLEVEGVRKYLHQCWAEALDRSLSIPPHTRYAAVARHEARADRLTEAIHHFERGAEQALETGAPGEAEGVLREALALGVPARSHTLHLLAQAHAVQGRYEEALNTLGEMAARDTAHSPSHVPHDAQLLRLEALHRLRRQSTSTLRMELTALLDNAALDSSLRLRGLQLRAELAREDGDPIELGEVLRTIETYPSTHAVDSARALLTRGFVRWQQGRFRESYRSLQEACRGFTSLRLRHEAARAANGAGIAAMATGRWELAFQHFAMALDHASRLRDADIATAVIGNAGLAAEDFGYSNEAIWLDNVSLTLATRFGAPRRAVMTALNLADIYLIGGQIDAAEEAYSQGRSMSVASGDEAKIQVLFRGPDFAFVRGDYEQAAILVDELREYLQARAIDVFLKPRLLRQMWTIAVALDQEAPDVAEICKKGGWTLYGRCEAGLAQACYRSHGSGTSKPVTRALHRTMELVGSTPLRWIVRTGLYDLIRNRVRDQHDLPPVSDVPEVDPPACAPAPLQDFIHASEEWIRDLA